MCKPVFLQQKTWNLYSSTSKKSILLRAWDSFQIISFDKNWFTHLNFRSITGGFIYNFNSSESFLKIVKTTEKIERES